VWGGVDTSGPHAIANICGGKKSRNNQGVTNFGGRREGERLLHEGAKIPIGRGNERKSSNTIQKNTKKRGPIREEEKEGGMPRG